MKHLLLILIAFLSTSIADAQDKIEFIYFNTRSWYLTDSIKVDELKSFTSIPDGNMNKLEIEYKNGQKNVLMVKDLIDIRSGFVLLPPKYYITGSINGWSNQKNTIFYPHSQDILSFTSVFNEGDAFLLNQYRDSEIITLGAMDETLREEGSLIENSNIPITVPSSGLWTIIIDAKNMEYSWMKEENPDAPTYDHISLCGSFNFWENLDLVQITPHNWYISNFTSDGGGFKIKANYSWDENWGNPYGYGCMYYLECYSGGYDMTLTSGTYDLYFNDITHRCVFIQTK